MKKRINRTFFVCKMLEQEVKNIYEQSENERQNGEVEYCDKLLFFTKSMHKNPKELHTFLDEMIKKEEKADEIILIYGFCGRAMEGLQSDTAKLILPKFDDCIQMMLYTGKRHTRSLTNKESLYLTKGWSEDEDSILPTCQKITKDYKEEANEILNHIYGSYRTITFLDTKTYDMNQLEEETKEVKQYLQVSFERKDVNLCVLKNLILGNYMSEIIIKQPKNQVSYKDYEI